MSSIKLKHSGGNAVSIAAPDTNPTSDRTVKLPSTDADGVITTKDSSNNLQSVSGVNNGQFSHRNLLINGDMYWWERGTSGTTSGGYVCDRFWGAGTGITFARNDDAPDGFRFSSKLTYANNALAIGQPVELIGTGVQGRLVSGQKCTLSFYAKVDSGTEVVNSVLNFRSSKFSSTNSVAFTAVGSANNTITTSWARYTTTFTIPTCHSSSTMAAMEVAGIDRTMYLTGFQLEMGDTATDFEHLPIGYTLGLCKRYFQKAGSRHYGMVEGTTQFRMQIPLEPPMRAAPTLNVRSGSVFNTRYQGDTSITNPTLNAPTSKKRDIWTGVSTSGRVGGTPIYGRSQQGDTGDFIACNAEL